MYDAVERGHDLGPCRSPDIDAQVEAAGLGFRRVGGVGRCAPGAWRFAAGAGNHHGLIKMCATGIKRPVLAVTANTILSVMLMQGMIDPGGELIGIGNGRRRKAGIVFREIECKKPIPARIKRYDRMIVGAMPVQNGDQ